MSLGRGIAGGGGLSWAVMLSSPEESGSERGASPPIHPARLFSPSPYHQLGKGAAEWECAVEANGCCGAVVSSPLSEERDAPGEWDSPEGSSAGSSLANTPNKAKSGSSTPTPPPTPSWHMTERKADAGVCRSVAEGIAEASPASSHSTASTNSFPSPDSVSPGLDSLWSQSASRRDAAAEADSSCTVSPPSRLSFTSGVPALNPYDAAESSQVRPPPVQPPSSTDPACRLSPLQHLEAPRPSCGTLPHVTAPTNAPPLRPPDLPPLRPPDLRRSPQRQGSQGSEGSQSALSSTSSSHDTVPSTSERSSPVAPFRIAQGTPYPLPGISPFRSSSPMSSSRSAVIAAPRTQNLFSSPSPASALAASPPADASPLPTPASSFSPAASLPPAAPRATSWERVASFGRDAPASAPPPRLLSHEVRFSDLVPSLCRVAVLCGVAFVVQGSGGGRMWPCWLGLGAHRRTSVSPHGASAGSPQNTDADSVPMSSVALFLPGSTKSHLLSVFRC